MEKELDSPATRVLVVVAELTEWEGRMAFYANMLGPLRPGGLREIRCSSADWSAWREGLPAALEHERLRLSCDDELPRQLTPAAVRDILTRSREAAR